MRLSPDDTLPDAPDDTATKRSGGNNRNPARAQRAIIEAATAEFAEHGIGGARIERIAQRAGVNKRLLYYYFGSKEDLFVAVLERTYADIRAAEQLLHLDELDPIEAIRQLVSFTWRYYLQHPQFLHLLNTENLHHAEHLKRSATKVKELNSPLVQMIETVLDRGRHDNLFRAGIDPVQLYISIASLAYFYFSNVHTLSAMFDRDLRSPKAQAERLSHITDLVLGYLLR